MSRRDHKHTAWAWFKAEIEREIGPSAADALWSEYARRAKADKRHNDRCDAPETIARLESRMLRADAAEQRRLMKRIARLKALMHEEE